MLVAVSHGLSVSLGLRVFLVGAAGTAISLVVGSKSNRRNSPDMPPQAYGSWLGVRYLRFMFGPMAAVGLILMLIAAFSN